MPAINGTFSPTGSSPTTVNVGPSVLSQAFTTPVRLTTSGPNILVSDSPGGSFTTVSAGEGTVVAAGTLYLFARELATLTATPVSSSPIKTLPAGPLSLFRRALAKVKAGTGSAKIACVGDSLTVGWNAAGNGYIGARPFAFAAQLAAALTAAGYPAVANAFHGDGNVGINSQTVFQYDPRLVSVVPGWVGNNSGNTAFAGNPITSSTAGASFTFTPGGLYDSFDVFVNAALGGGGLINVSVGGVQIGQVDCGTATGAKKQSFTCTRTNGPITFTANSSAGVYLTGCAPYDSQASQIYVHSIAGANATAGSWTNADYGIAKWIGTNPAQYDLSIIGFGTNELGGGVTASVFQTNLQTMLNLFRGTGGDAAFRTGPQSTGVAFKTYRTLYDGMYAAAGAQIPVSDAIAYAGLYADAAAAGLMSDGVHWAREGYALDAREATRIILANAA